jgi:copper chaperone
MTSAAYQVTGMTCEHCARAVTEELENLDGVRGVTVELNPGGASTVTVTSDARLSSEAIQAALGEAGGYQLAGQTDGASTGGDGQRH